MASLLALLRASSSVRGRVLAVLALYAAYLPLSGYTMGHFRYDAAEYWDLSLKFTAGGHFSLLAFDDPLRGYLGPLLLLPARLLCHYTGWSILTGTRLLGAGWAALLFGVAIPALWQRLTSCSVPWGRWLLLLGLTFVFWRDYFNFSLTDMPALTLLLLGLAVLGRAGWGGVAAGLCLAAAINLRPVYLASVPAFGWLASRRPAAGGIGTQVACLALGAALVLLPQWVLNHRHFNQNTPLVLARLPDMQTHSLYLEKLSWGLEQQKYETRVGTDYPVPVLVFRDVAGTRLLREAHTQYFYSYRAYAAALLRHPLTAAGIYTRHLFNGLDLQYPTPYIRQVYRPTWALAWLNYTLWFGVALLLGRGRWRSWPLGHWLVLAALLLPCAAVLPVGMECRYLLPLHLLLCAALCLGWPAEWTGKHLLRLPLPQRLLLGAGYFAAVALCFLASAAAQATLEYGPRSLF